MSDGHDYLRTSAGSFRLKADVLLLMMRGAGYALIFCLILGLAGWALVGLSRLLPPESKEGLDPRPASLQIEMTSPHPRFA